MGYDEWQEAHPTHAIIMKMGFFYSALRYAAEVVSYCTGYRLGTWTNGIKITGAPNTDRMEQALCEMNISYLIIENDVIVGRHDGRDYRTAPLRKLTIVERNAMQVAALREECKELEPAVEIINLFDQIIRDNVHVGNELIHREFGRGTVTFCGDNKIKVQFETTNKTLSTRMIFAKRFVELPDLSEEWLITNEGILKEADSIIREYNEVTRKLETIQKL